MSLYECRVYDAKGKLKETVGFKMVTEKYWQQFTLETADYVDMPSNLTNGKKRMYTIECSFCKKTVKVVRKHAKYCTPQCKGEAAYAIQKARIERAASRRYTLKCVICEKEWQALKPYSKYCNVVCKKKQRLYQMRRKGEQIKANLIGRKLEVARRQKKIFQRELSTAPEGSQDGQAHSVSTD